MYWFRDAQVIVDRITLEKLRTISEARCKVALKLSIFRQDKWPFPIFSKRRAKMFFVVALKKKMLISELLVMVTSRFCCLPGDFIFAFTT